jgi:hypothetical protein
MSWVGERFTVLRRRVFLPVAPPTTFLDSEAIRERLETDDPVLAAELLAQAREIGSAPQDRVEGVERRATTLLGTVGIATSLSVAGAALVLDPSKLHGDAWRIAVAIGFFLATLCFVMCGVRAVQALADRQTWMAPRDEDILNVRSKGLAKARVDLAVSILRSAGANDPIADWKVAYLGAARWWFTRALAALIVTALVLVLYVGFGSSAAVSRVPSDRTPRIRHSVTVALEARIPQA